jgi:carotenoid 1,2-hydratase
MRDTGGLRFDAPVGPGGYRWWYLDAFSADGAHGLTVIAFIGSVFSPYYAWARRRGRGDPLDHCAINVALYGAAGKRWSMVERGAAAVHRQPDRLAIGASSVAWDGNALVVSIDEITVPWPSRIRGTVRLYPAVLCDQPFALDRAGLHRWFPLAPVARVEVELEHPALRWSGTGYLDSNAGAAPLEQAFSGWSWSRAGVGGGTALLYDVARRADAPLSLALYFDAAGRLHHFPPPPPAPLPRTGWRIERATRADAGHAARLVHTLEDTPFYARSMVEARLLGAPATAMHESLSLDRFRQRWVQMLLPFRMPRRHA